MFYCNYCGTRIGVKEKKCVSCGAAVNFKMSEEGKRKTKFISFRVLSIVLSIMTVFFGLIPAVNIYKDGNRSNNPYFKAHGKKTLSITLMIMSGMIIFYGLIIFLIVYVVTRHF